MTTEQERLAAIGEAVERLFDGHDAKIEYLAPDPTDDFGGGWMASRSRGKYPEHPNASRPWLVGEGDTLLAAVDAALSDRGEEAP